MAAIMVYSRDVYLYRIAGMAHASIPRTVIQHSPDGFEWGYAGSGPADLALNVLNAFVPPACDDLPPVACYRGHASQTAIQLHQPFKTALIAPMPHDGGVIPVGTIRDFINAAFPEIIKP